MDVSQTAISLQYISDADEFISTRYEYNVCDSNAHKQRTPVKPVY